MQQAGARRLRDDEQPRGRAAKRTLRLVEPGADSPSGRRTVTITGHPGHTPRRRSPTEARMVARPDRVALWAFVLGLFLVFVAAATAHAAPLA
jgi:hypothetical protein